MTKRITTTEATTEDTRLEGSLRPRTLSEYIGQTKVKDTMAVYIKAAKARGEALDHVLLFGPPGLGKTTLANIIANEMGVNLRQTSGPAIDKPGDMAAILSKLQKNDILFIDEIHRLNRQVEELLYSAMEDFGVDIIIGSGPAAKPVRLKLPKFTLVGATTRAGMLTAPLRDRFGLQYRLELYGDKDIEKILMRSARILGVEISEEAARLLGGRCRGTPRVANRVLRRCRDVAQVRGTGAIDVNSTAKTLEMLGIDGEGLDPTDRKILAMMIDKFDGGPVGLGTISAALGEEPDTLEEVYEPYLIRKGLLARTPRGRTATQSAYRMFHRDPPQKITGTPSDQIELF